MNFLEISSKRYSCRNYTNQSVSAEDLNYILECARIAPSAVNLQPWRFYVITTESLRNDVISCYKREWIAQAPVYIVCTIRHDEEWVRRMDGKAHGNIDIAIAAEHIILAAAERGLGSCWVCNFDAARLHSLLSLPEEEEAAVIIPIGHIDTNVEVKRTERKATDEIIKYL